MVLLSDWSMPVGVSFLGDPQWWVKHTKMVPSKKDTPFRQSLLLPLRDEGGPFPQGIIHLDQPTLHFDLPSLLVMVIVP